MSCLPTTALGGSVQGPVVFKVKQNVTIGINAIAV